MTINKIRFLVLAIISNFAIFSTQCAFAQCSFSSGSTGADGAFNPTNSMPSTGWSRTNNIVTVTNSASGIFNFTTITIATNWIVKFTKNTLNTPVYLLATSNVTINGEISVDGSPQSQTSTAGGAGGPGGFDGGQSVYPDGSMGFGPGVGGPGEDAAYALQSGGYTPPYGQTYGVIDILPMIGGSGGGGQGNSQDGRGGSGGGGAILIASSGTLTCPGTISANSGLSGPSGSGGSIRLIANTITGEGVIQAYDNQGASIGRIRLEDCNNLRMSLTDPAATYGLPGVVFLPTNPVIFVASIAGTNTPAIPTASLTVPDINLPSNFTNPATILVTASNIPPNTLFQVIVDPVHGTNLFGSNTLVGTYAFSSNTVSMTVYTDRVWRVNAMIPYIPRP